MINITPEDYDYLWTDYDVNFIFTSCYIFKEFKDADFLLIYDYKNKSLEFFLSKKEREKFSEYGIKFLDDNKFGKWKQKIKENIAVGKLLIEQTKTERKKTGSMSNSELKTKIYERVNLFQALGGNYFYTEFFFFEKVEKLLEQRKWTALAKNFDEMGKLKLAAREVLTNFYNYAIVFEPYVAEVGKRFNRNDIEWLSWQEIIGILDSRKVRISERGNKNWILGKKTGWKVIIGKQAREFIPRFDKSFDANVKEIKGTIANKGFYTGKAKIIKTLFSNKLASELKKMCKGDVLVAETTGPDMILACKLAGAIVTDEGGLTSHAAVVSRELGIPCIVNAKTATKILKDGEFIEVDANSGIVRRVKCQ